MQFVQCPPEALRAFFRAVVSKILSEKSGVNLGEVMLSCGRGAKQSNGTERLSVGGRQTTKHARKQGASARIASMHLYRTCLAFLGHLRCRTLVPGVRRGCLHGPQGEGGEHPSCFLGSVPGRATNNTSGFNNELQSKRN